MLYKLTTQDGRTRVGEANETEWGENIEHEAIGPESGALCSDSWIHAYTDPLLAVFLNPIHADIDNPVLWEAEGVVGKSDGLKVGCRKLKTVREIDLPAVTIEQRIRFSILCIKQAGKDKQWNAWADKWLSGEDRSQEKAVKCISLEWTAAASAVEWAVAEWVAESAGRATRAAEWAARAAERAIESAGTSIDWAPIAKQAMED